MILARRASPFLQIIRKWRKWRETNHDRTVHIYPCCYLYSFNCHYLDAAGERRWIDRQHGLRGIHFWRPNERLYHQDDGNFGGVLSGHVFGIGHPFLTEEQVVDDRAGAAAGIDAKARAGCAGTGDGARACCANAATHATGTGHTGARR